jgi:hypothetical protein
MIVPLSRKSGRKIFTDTCNTLIATEGVHEKKISTKEHHLDRLRLALLLQPFVKEGEKCEVYA